MSITENRVLMAWRPAYEATTAIVWLIMALVNYVIGVTLDGQSGQIAGLSLIMVAAAFIRGKAAYDLWMLKAKISLPIVLEEDMNDILAIHNKYGRKSAK